MEPDPPDPESTIRIEIGKPITFEGGPRKGEPDPALSRIVDTLKAYRKAVVGLVQDKYASVADQLPPHLQRAVDMFVLQCSDGLIVRSDIASSEPSKIRFSRVAGTLEDLAPKFSEGVVHVPSDPATYELPDAGPCIKLTRVGVDGTTQDIVTIRPTWFTSAVLPYTHPAPPERPHCLASMTNQINLELGGTIEPIEVGKREIGVPVEQFLATARTTLTVGWLAIEVYPNLLIEHWDPALAPLWAELDLLSHVAQANLRAAGLLALDGRGEARRCYSALLEEFERLLAGPEEPVHQFLKRHPELINPTYDRAWSKVPFGDRKSDFVFREPPLDYELVEIEAAHREMFREDGQQRQELTHAINQITDWIQYVQNNKRDVEETLGLVGISTNPRCLVVIGRSASLTDANRRKLETIVSMIPKLRLLTYDDVLATARANIERLFGPLSIVSNMQLHFFQS